MSQLIYVEMKTRRAQQHFDALKSQLDMWMKDPKRYTVTEKTDFDKGTHIVRVEIGHIYEDIPMLLSDFIHCLRSSLDCLAWELAHLPSERTLTIKEEKRVQFPISPYDDGHYSDIRGLFPSTVANIFDSLQPYLRGNAFRDDPLWKLNELWTMDKHRGIPMNSNGVQIRFPFAGWERYLRHFHYGIEVHFPLIEFFSGEMEIKPAISVEILFGEFMGEFMIDRAGLSEINDFVRNDVIPRFSGFFT